MLARKLGFLALLFMALSAASQPATAGAERVIHRTHVEALDGSGWQLAASTGGGFSVRVPVPFDDASIRSTEPGLELVVHVITGSSADGVRFSATEMVATGANAKDPDIGEMPQDLAEKRGSKVVDLKRETKDGVDTISFQITSPRSSAYMRIVKIKNALYHCVMEFPEAQRAEALAAKDQFFASFTIKN